MASINECELTEILREVLDASGSSEQVDLEEIDTEHVLGGCRVATFEERGVLTRNEGLVLRLADGSEYQITIVRSK